MNEDNAAAPAIRLAPVAISSKERGVFGALRSSPHARHLFAMLAALVLVMRLLAPSGFMPVRSDHGIVVALCTGAGPVTVTLDGKQTGDRDKSHQSGLSDHCPYSGGVAAPMLPFLAAEALLPAWQGAHGVIAFALKTGWIARLAAPPPPQSGPPPAL